MSVEEKLKVSIPKKCIRKVIQSIPKEIIENEKLNERISKNLPANYKFEIHKTLWQIQKNNSKRVALQFPEGLLMFSCIISDILEEFGRVETVIMGDVTYGACCVDDYTARSLGCDMLVHYGHSCLVPIDVTSIKTMYVFVEISINLDHFVSLIKKHFSTTDRLAFVSTVQFLASLHEAKRLIGSSVGEIVIPQSKPLSKGEILGCTAPSLTSEKVDYLVYLGDGRFHLEAIMIANPSLKAFRYDPYSKVFSAEEYETDSMKEIRLDAIRVARTGRKVGLILGTLGRQGSSKVLKSMIDKIEEKGLEYVTILLSEISPQKLSMFQDIDFYIQVACPRLSIDWGYSFNKPLLTPYEASVAFEKSEWYETYPMDYYSHNSKGDWTVY